MNSPERLTVYIDFKSPYSYVAVRPLIELAKAEAVALEWLPFNIKLNAADPGTQPRAIYPMRKIRYMYMDVRRYATPQGLVIKGPERIFDGALAGIGMLFAQDHGFFEAYRDRVFEKFFKRELDIDDLQALSLVIRELGGNSADFAVFVNGDGRVRHEQIQVRAEAEGVFGVPSMLLNGELFWGNDRVELLRQRLRETRSRAVAGPR